MQNLIKNSFTHSNIHALMTLGNSMIKLYPFKSLPH